MTIKINETEYVFKQTYKAIMIWEQIAQRPFEIKNTTDNLLYYYSILLANNKEECLSFDEFIEALDNEPMLLLEMTKKLTKYQEFEKLLNPNDEESSEDNKKKD